MQSTLERHRRLCAKKRHYRTEKEALRAVRDYYKRIYEADRAERPMIAYQCYHCTEWCIGHRTALDSQE